MEKLNGEVLCKHYMEDYHMEMRVARLHNIYGPKGAWKGGRYLTHTHSLTRQRTHAVGDERLTLCVMRERQGEGAGSVLQEGDLLTGQL
jgi:nucleoside-diphosphate-sugar epimerase